MSDLEEIRQRKAEELRNRFGDDGDGAAEGGEDRSTPVHVRGDAHFEELIHGERIVLVDFYADWCGPCKMLEPIVAEVAAETPATVAKVDIDEHQQLAQQYRVQGVPTMHLFVEGESVEQLVGVRDKGQLVSLIDQYA